MRILVDQTNRAALSLALLCGGFALGGSAYADELTSKDVQIAAKAIGFLDPAPSGEVVVAIVFPTGDAAGRKSAETIAGYFGDGLKAKEATLKAKIVDSAALGNGSGYAAIIAVGTASSEALATASKAQHIPCITSDMASVQAGHCTIGINTAGKVDIVLNRAGASAAGFSFAAAFRMMIREV